MDSITRGKKALAAISAFSIFAFLLTAATASADPESGSFKSRLSACADELMLNAAPPARIHLVSCGASRSVQYLSASLAFILETKGYSTRHSTVPAAACGNLDGMEEPPSEILPDIEADAFVLALAADYEDDDRSMTVELRLWRTDPRGPDAYVQCALPVPALLLDIADTVPESPSRHDLVWHTLFARLAGECNPARRGPEEGWRLNQGIFFFQHGYWNKAADALDGVVHDTVTHCFFRQIIALQYSVQADKAREKVDHMLKLYPDSGPLYALKAWLSFRSGDAEDAAMLLEQARLSDVAREGLYIFAEYLVLVRSGSEEEAEAPLLRAVEQMRDAAFIQLQAARYYWRKAKLEESVRFYRRAIEAGAGDAELYLELGLALNAAGDSEAAIEAFMNVFQFRRGDLSIARHLSTMIRSAGRYEEALRVLAECVEANPESASAAATLGDLRRNVWRIEESIEAYKKAIERDPACSYSRTALASAYLLKGKTGRAIELIDELMEHNSKNPEALLLLGQTLLHRGEIKKAIETFRKAIQEPEYEYAARIVLSGAMAETGETDAAIREAQLAVSSNPGPLAFAALAEALMKAARLRDARQSIDKGFKSAPDSPDLIGASIRLAMLSADAADTEERQQTLYSEALKMAMNAMETQPFHLDYYLLAGRSALALHDYELAGEMWKRAAGLDRWDAELAWNLARLYHDRLESPERAAPFFRRHIELGGDHAEEAARFEQ